MGGILTNSQKFSSSATCLSVDMYTRLLRRVSGPQDDTTTAKKLL